MDLPLGATEERVVGTLSVEAALGEGRLRFEPGLLAAAHRGVLYIDEVNLLPDHLVDVLLDAAASGVNVVERDGLSVAHPSRFILVGTMNPEEGELRPQLLDRFGLMAEAENIEDARTRQEALRRRLAFDANPAAFAASWEAEEQRWRTRLRSARERLGEMELPETVGEAIAELCIAGRVEGLRADLALYRAVRALAAWEGRVKATLEDVRRAAPLVLAHRQRRQPFEEPRLDPALVEEVLERFEGRDGKSDGDGGGSPAADGPGGGSPGGDAESGPRDGEEQPGDASPGNQLAPRGESPGPIARVARWRQAYRGRTAVSGGGRRTEGWGPRGRAQGEADRRRAAGAALDLAATVRARALGRCRGAAGADVNGELRWRRRRSTGASLLVLAVDTSGSMGARRRLWAARGIAESFLLDAYRRRDRVAVVTFRGHGATLNLAPSRNIERARAVLGAVRTGGRTPLGAGLAAAARAVEAHLRREAAAGAYAVVITDGRGNTGHAGLDALEAMREGAFTLDRTGATTAVVDAGGPSWGNRFRGLAAELGWRWVDIDQAMHQGIPGLVRRGRGVRTRTGW
ncbi:VWA domain-containing protein [Tepidiforma sp.]|uniref:VWA domain-containing protein n=1 Tax=Tepidiforma sp. TaxID=2682230 RepID=UPI002ADE527B|nr:VWA domain-containing protein [Tepidiforma sp.]